MVVEGCTGGFCEKLLDISPLEPMLAGSKTDMMLGMAGLISNGGRDAGITQLGKGEKSCTTAARQRSESVSETALQTHRSVQKQEEELL